MLKESFGKRKKNFTLFQFCGGRCLTLWQKLPLIHGVLEETGFMFSIYIACLILGFSVDTENTATAVVALPCPVDFVWLNMSSILIQHDDKDLLDIVARQWFSVQFSFKIPFNDFHLLSVLWTLKSSFSTLGLSIGMSCVNVGANTFIHEIVCCNTSLYKVCKR